MIKSEQKSIIKPLLIRGHIIDPGQGIDEIGSLLITEGRIAWLGKGGVTPPQPDYDILYAQGLIVCPGFVDLHCHLRQPGFEEKETIATGTQAAARGGFTTICCMPNTNPPLDNQSSIDYVKSTAATEGVVRVALGTSARPFRLRLSALNSRHTGHCRLPGHHLLSGQGVAHPVEQSRVDWFHSVPLIRLTSLWVPLIMRHLATTQRFRQSVAGGSCAAKPHNSSSCGGLVDSVSDAEMRGEG